MPKNGTPKSAILVVIDSKGVTTKNELTIGKTANAKHFTLTPKAETDTLEAYGKLYLKP